MPSGSRVPRHSCLARVEAIHPQHSSEPGCALLWAGAEAGDLVPPPVRRVILSHDLIELLQPPEPSLLQPDDWPVEPLAGYPLVAGACVAVGLLAVYLGGLVRPASPREAPAALSFTGGG